MMMSQAISKGKNGENIKSSVEFLTLMVFSGNSQENQETIFMYVEFDGGMRMLVGATFNGTYTKIQILVIINK